MKVQINILRIVLYISVFIFALFIYDGLSIFIYTSIIIIFSLLLYFWFNPRFFKLSMFFELGFLYMMSTEGIFRSQNVIFETSYEFYCIGSKYINLSFAIIMIFALMRSFFLYQHKYRLYKVVKFRNKNLFFFLLITVSSIFLYFMAKKAIKMGSVGRLGMENNNPTYNDIPIKSISDLIISAYSGFAYIFPTLLLYMKFNHNNKLFNYLPYIAIPPIIIMEILIGSRTFVLYTLVGILIIIQSRSLKVNWSGVLVVAVLLIFLSSLMTNYRNVGFSKVQLSSVSSKVNKDISSPSDAILWQCRIVEYYSNNHDYENGANLLTALAFWVPRALWLNKPTMIDYWFARTYLVEQGFANNHSIVTGFSGLFYSDFGFWGGLLCCVFVGLFIGQLEFFVFRCILNKGDPFIIFASLSFGIILFFVRAFGSLIPPLSGCFLLIYLFRKVFFEIY